MITRRQLLQGDHTTGLPLLPSPVVMGVNPAISSEGAIPATQQFSLQQSLTAAPQNSPSAVPQTPLSQLQGHSPVYSTTQHLVSLQQQVSILSNTLPSYGNYALDGIADSSSICAHLQFEKL